MCSKSDTNVAEAMKNFFQKIIKKINYKTFSIKLFKKISKKISKFILKKDFEKDFEKKIQIFSKKS